MRVRSFRGEDVHGYLRFDVALNDDLTFLNGINGSGKTTIVNSIVSLITPDLDWLMTTDYRKLAVDIDLDGVDISIETDKTDKRFTLRCSAVSKSLTIPLASLEEERTAPRYFRTSSGRVILRNRPSRVLPGRLANHEVLTAIAALPTPMFLGLERTTRRSSRIEPEPDFEELEEHPRNVFRSSLDESLREAGAIARDAYQDLRRQQEVLTSELRRRLILSAFRYQEDVGDFPARFPGREAINDIDRHLNDVQNVLIQLGIGEPEVTQHVRPFFVVLKQIITELPSGKKVDEFLSSPGRSLTDAIVRWFQIRPQESLLHNLPPR